MHAMKRREFLQGSALLMAGSVGCSSEDEPAGGGADYTPVPVEPGRAAVGIVNAENVEHAVRRAIALAGGLTQIQPGQSVFIKPNAVHGATYGVPGVVTSTEVLKAVIRAVKERKPGHIIVGDRSWRQSPSSAVFKTTGLEDAALEAGADEVYPAPTPADDPPAWALTQPPFWEETWTEDGGILAMKKILDSDHLIEIPVLKNHRWAAFSLSMKNLMGAVGDDSRDPMHFNEGDPDRLSRDIAILNGIFQPTLVVLDAQMALVNGGPEGVLSDKVFTSPGLILASSDRIALDAAGVSVLKRELASATVPSPDAMHEILKNTPSWLLPQIVHGIDLGLGIASADLVDLRFEDVAASADIESVFRAT
jgi:uncharacterized protein (DUF362 family)